MAQNRAQLADLELQTFKASDELAGAFQPTAEEPRVIKAQPKLSFPAYVISKLNELRFIKFALASFVVNNLRRRYQRSFLGFAWSLLNPLLMMIVLTTVFSLIFKRDPKTFSIYLFTGLLPWTFISTGISAGCLSITGAESFMKKVYVPKLFFPLVTCLTEVINFILSLASMSFLALFVGLHVHKVILLLPFAILVSFLFTFGLSLALAVATVYFRDLTHLVQVVLQSFFYLIPIVYPMNAVPPKYAAIFAANPFTHFINLYREIIYYGNPPTAQEWLIPIGYSMITLTIGFYILMKREKDIIYRL